MSLKIMEPCSPDRLILTEQQLVAFGKMSGLISSLPVTENHGVRLACTSQCTLTEQLVAFGKMSGLIRSLLSLMISSAVIGTKLSRPLPLIVCA